MHECPNCGAEMDHLETELDVGVEGCWFCCACEMSVSDADDYDESDD